VTWIGSVAGELWGMLGSRRRQAFRRSVAEHRVLAGGEHGCHPEALPTEPTVANSKNSAMNAVEAAATQTCFPPLAMDADPLELL
jgi:hypothetical protein